MIPPALKAQTDQLKSKVEMVRLSLEIETGSPMSKVEKYKLVPNAKTPDLS